MNRREPKVAEVQCPGCHGTGFPAVKQPLQPGRKIFPAPCKQCLGKGRVPKESSGAIAPTPPLSSHVKIEDFASCPVADIRCAGRKRLGVTKICRGVILGLSNGFRTFKRRIAFTFL
jgi:hypothetical protein